MDIKHQMEIMTLLSSLNIEHHLTIVAVLHDINLAAAFCKDVCLMKTGQIIDIGPTKNLITYKNIKAIFETEVYVGLNDLTGTPYYIPIKQD
jgi:iron complex transport system ATP-binding protein